MRDLLYGSYRYIRKERAESFRYRRVNENGVSELGIWQVGQHRRLHRSQNLAGLGANHREAENAFVAPIDKNLHEALCFVRCLRPQHSAHRQPRDTHGDTLLLRFAFTESHVGERRVREQAVWNQPIARGALSSGQILPDDSKVVDGRVREVRATGAFTIAQTPGAVVSSRSLARTYLRSSNSTPIFSSPIPAVFGMRPVATKISLPSIFC